MHYSANCLSGSCYTGIWHLAANALIILDTWHPPLSKIECKLSQTSVCCITNKNRQSSIHNRSGVGVTKPISSVPFFPKFSALSKHTLDIGYHVYIWQVSPQLSCGGTCLIWKWFNEYNRYFCQIEILLTAKLTNGALITPTPDTYSKYRKPKMLIILMKKWRIFVNNNTKSLEYNNNVVRVVMNQWDWSPNISIEL